MFLVVYFIFWRLNNAVTCFILDFNICSELICYKKEFIEKNYMFRSLLPEFICTDTIWSWQRFALVWNPIPAKVLWLFSYKTVVSVLRKLAIAKIMMYFIYFKNRTLFFFAKNASNKNTVTFMLITKIIKIYMKNTKDIKST